MSILCTHKYNIIVGADKKDLCSCSYHKSKSNLEICKKFLHIGTRRKTMYSNGKTSMCILFGRNFKILKQ